MKRYILSFIFALACFFGFSFTSQAAANEYYESYWIDYSEIADTTVQGGNTHHKVCTVPSSEYKIAYYVSANHFYFVVSDPDAQVWLDYMNGYDTPNAPEEWRPQRYHSSGVLNTNIPWFNSKAEAQAYVATLDTPRYEADVQFDDIRADGYPVVNITWSDVTYNPLAVGVLNPQASFYTVSFHSFLDGSDVSIFDDVAGVHSLYSEDGGYNFFSFDLRNYQSSMSGVYSVKLIPTIVKFDGSEFHGKEVNFTFNPYGIGEPTRPPEDRGLIFDENCSFSNLTYRVNSIGYQASLDSKKTDMVFQWDSVLVPSTASSVTVPDIYITCQGQRQSIDSKLFVNQGSIDYKTGRGYKYFNKGSLIYIASTLATSNFNGDISPWELHIRPTYTDGFNDYYGKEFVLLMYGSEVNKAGFLSDPMDNDRPSDVSDPLPPSDWVDDPFIFDPIGDIKDFDFSQFGSLMTNLVTYVGQVPALVASCLGFLPTIVVELLVFGIFVVVALRILGR